MAYASSTVGEAYAPVKIENETGNGGFVFVCEHASNYIPPSFGGLGLTEADRENHIAWDPGALGLARGLSRRLSSPLIAAGLSRLLIDCNRDIAAPDLIPECSELTRISGNEGLNDAARSHRISLSHTPFHAAVESVVSGRLLAGTPPAIVSLHTFTPIYKGTHRPWDIGLIYDQDMSLAAPALEALKSGTGHIVGDNEPYSPADGVFYTLNRHGQSKGLPHLMIEVRNDLIQSPEQEEAWADTLASILQNALDSLSATPETGATHA
ncbi:N-formylglutamate amidohydrolase [Roseibium sp.]|uniref:N-formylglutamate amidohydrolase n=1 Tax=Roseibium sp. TaxID=1936156 RepID=UPI003A978E10